MDYQEFVVQMRHLLEVRFAGTGIELEPSRVMKNNDCEKEGVLLRNGPQAAAPAVYFEDLYQMYTAGIPMDVIAERVAEAARADYRIFPPEMYDPEDFETMKSHITFRVLNTACNRKYLEDVVHVDYLDLSLTFYCTVITGNRGDVFSTKITEELMTKWGLDREQLLEIAKENTPQMLGVYLKEMKEVLLEIAEEESPEDKEELLEVLENPDRNLMYVLSNRPRHSGAVNMFVPGVLSELAGKLQDDLYIIPSSIHEVLLIPCSGHVKKEETDSMIASVNREVLQYQDILSDHLYIYRRDLDRIVM